MESQPNQRGPDNEGISPDLQHALRVFDLKVTPPVRCDGRLLYSVDTTEYDPADLSQHITSWKVTLALMDYDKNSKIFDLTALPPFFTLDMPPVRSDQQFSCAKFIHDVRVKLGLPTSFTLELFCWNGFWRVYERCSQATLTDQLKNMYSLILKNEHVDPLLKMKADCVFKITIDFKEYDRCVVYASLSFEHIVIVFVCVCVRTLG